MSTDRLKQVMVKIVTQMKVKFSLRGKAISNEEVFADNGLLPGLARRADQLCSLCLGYGIGVKFDKAQGTTLGIKATFDEMTPDILRYLCVIDVLNDLINAAASKDSVALDALLYD